MGWEMPRTSAWACPSFSTPVWSDLNYLKRGARGPRHARPCSKHPHLPGVVPEGPRGCPQASVQCYFHIPGALPPSPRTAHTPKSRHAPSLTTTLPLTSAPLQAASPNVTPEPTREVLVLTFHQMRRRLQKAAGNCWT